MVKTPKLTDKQSLFCTEYLIDLNATQAAVRAGYSVKTAQKIGSENLSKPLVSDEIQRLMALRSKKTGITAEWVLEGIENLTNRLIDSEDPKAAYKGFELAGKHLALFTEKVEIGGEVQVTQIERKIV